MADRLGWFSSHSVDVVDLMKQKGEAVKAITAPKESSVTDADGHELTPLERELQGGVFEFSAEDLEVLQREATDRV
jgi:hypothetical protein